MSLEKKQEALAATEERLDELEAREVTTQEEVEARNTELAEATSEYEKQINDLKETRKREELRASAREVSTPLSPSGAVTVEAKPETRAIKPYDAKPSKYWESAEQALLSVAALPQQSSLSLEGRLCAAQLYLERGSEPRGGFSTLLASLL